MAYKLSREDGELLHSFQLKTHDGCLNAEVRDHEGVFPGSIVVWYLSDKRWKILVSGASAERFVNE